MGSEISAIIVATSFKLLFFDHRVRWDFGYEAAQAPAIGPELGAAAFALCLEAVCDVVAMTVQSYQGRSMLIHGTHACSSLKKKTNSY